jgi:hypothetical protein
MNEFDPAPEAERLPPTKHSSAGKPTQRLNWPEQSPLAPPPPSHRRRRLGLLLLGLGLLLLIIRLASLSIDMTDGLTLLTIAAPFFFFGFWRHIYGLIIPASILAGLSLGVTFDQLTGGASVLIGLATGFLLIYALGITIFGQRSIWPVIPAVILLSVGIIIAVSSMPGFMAILMLWAPLALIALGLYLGWMRRQP